MQWSLDLNKSKKVDYYVQVYGHFKNLIENNKMVAHEKLPSIRALAQETGLSRTTIENAYAQLVLEGYITSKRKSGFYVADIGMDFPVIHKSNPSAGAKDEKKSGALSIVSEDCFSFDSFKKMYMQILTDHTSALLSESKPQGEWPLRDRISDYVLKARGVGCSPDKILIGAGVQVLLGILCVLLRDMKFHKVAVEEPGFTEVRHIFHDYYLTCVPVSVTESGLNLTGLRQSDARVVYVSPTHQYPTGAVMPVTKRNDLLKWADTVGGYVIEDDYDSELRYEGKPVPGLKGLDTRDKVVYLGSFSTLLFPSFRISYMVLPDSCMAAYERVRDKYKQTVSKIEQLALALYIKEGEFERHLRRIRKKFANKRHLFEEAMEGCSRCRFVAEKTDSGVNIPLRFDRDMDMERLAGAMRNEGFRVRVITDRLLLINFVCIPENLMSQAVRALQKHSAACIR